MANPLKNEQELYDQIKRDGIKVPALIWDMMYRDLGECISAIEVTAYFHKIEGSCIPIDEAKKIQKHTKEIIKRVREILHLGTIDVHFDLDPILRELFTHYLSNDTNSINMIISGHLDPRDEQPVAVEYVEKIWKHAAAMRQFLDKLREATKQAVVIGEEGL